LAALWGDIKVDMKVEFENKDIDKDENKGYWVASVMEIKGIKGIYDMDHEREDLYLLCM
jgi:hypothetical protein